MFPIGDVLHLQYVAAGVPIRFAAELLRVPVPERCWAHACPGIETLFLSIAFKIVLFH